MEAYKKCIKCKEEKLLTEFRMFRGKLNKSCIPCLEKQKKNKEKNKCDHGRRRSQCKECGGASICDHGRLRSRCKDCGGASICDHGRRRNQCKECGGASICDHGRIRSQCKECGGASICDHGRQRSHCKECGGTSICDHGRQRNRCKECGGVSICDHGRQRSSCKDCDPCGHLKNIVSTRVRDALKNSKTERTLEYLGCDIIFYREYLEKQFKPGMTWDNYGEWQIDHIIPIMYKENEENEITLEETIKRLHYTNTQPLWAYENNSKSNRYIGDYKE